MHSDIVWPDVLGQAKAKRQMREFLRNGRLAHAYLFHGDQGVGKDALALHVARALHCQTNRTDPCGQCPSCLAITKLRHPDVHLVFALPPGKGERKGDDPMEKLSPDVLQSVREQLRMKGENPYHPVTVTGSTVIKVNSIRALRRETALSTADREKRVIIITRADQMNEESSNALLKTLEEPHRDTMFILTTAFPERLLPTIRSRCHPVRFDLLSASEIRGSLVSRGIAGEDTAGLVSLLAMGSYTRALDLLTEDISSEREKAVEFVRTLLGMNFSRLISAIEEVAGLRDRDTVLRFLNLLIIWFRDALVSREGGEIVNIDQERDIVRFLEKFPETDLAGVLQDVEQAVSLVERNGYIPLVLMRLSLELRRRILPPVSLVRS